MGIPQSSEIKYVYTLINGQNVLVPFIRFPNGQWVQLQSYYGQYNTSYPILNRIHYPLYPGAGVPYFY